MRRIVLPLLALALLGAACGGGSSQNRNANGSATTNAPTNADRSGSVNTNTVPANANAATNTNAAVLRTAIVKLTSAGVEPAQLSVVAGTVVAFVNEDRTGHWIASDPHPAHTGLPGFDAGSAIAPGATYTFTFTRTGTWAYHDHLDATNGRFTGSVVVAP